MLGVFVLGIIALMCALSSIIWTGQFVFGHASSSELPQLLGLYLLTLFVSYLTVGVYRIDPKKVEQLGPKRKDSPPSDADIRARGEARLKQLKPKAKHEPLLAVHAGGSGIPIQAGSAFFLSCREGSFAISHAISDEEVELPYGKITTIEVSGPGTEVTNAGLVGGGFGLEGALKGMAAAALVNAATTKKTTNTFLRIATNEGEAYFHFNNIEPAALRLALSPVVVAVEANKNKESSSGSFSIASELQKLHQLNKDGVITDDEFEATKKKIISGT